jgi:Fic family protein
MNTDRHSQAEQKDLIVDPIERARQEAQNGVIQFEMVLDIIQNHITPNQKPFKLKPSAILRLQEQALRGIHPLAGTFRNTAVSISGSKHAPPESFMVADEISDLCIYVNENWESRDALHLAAYLLWKLNWIHPFADGNGRTARAVSYLVMSLKLDSLLPGTRSLNR